MIRNIFCTITLAALALTGANAKTVTVSKNSADNADFTEIQTAIDSFGQIKDLDGTPNVVEILDNAAYEEIFTVNVHCSIIGKAEARPRLLVMTNSEANSIATAGNAATYDGLSINIPISVATTGTTVLKNLIVLPSRTSTPPDDGIITTTHNSFIHFDNLLVTSNNGSDQPVSSDGLSEADLSGATSFGDDGIFTGYAKPANVGMGHEFLMTNCVVTNMNGTTGASDGLVITGDGGRKYTIGEGNVFSFMGRLGVQATGNFTFSSATKPTLILGNKGFAGIWYAGTSSLAEYVRTIDGIHVINNIGFGIDHNNNLNRPAILKRSILAGNGVNLVVNTTNANGTLTLDRVTLANQTGANPTLHVPSGNTAEITALNSIIAGNGTTDPTNVIEHNGTGLLNLQHSAVITAGTSALNSTPVSGTGGVIGTAATNADPQFVQTNNPTAAAFYDVASPTFSNLNSFGTALVGGGKYAGATSSVADWNVY